MPYNFILILFFSIFFIALPVDGAIPIPDDKPEYVRKAKKKRLALFKKWSKDKNPNRNGLLSLIFGVASIILLPVLAIPAIILGIIALDKKEPETIMPIIGIITGGLVILAAIFLLVFFLIVLA